MVSSRCSALLARLVVTGSRPDQRDRDGSAVTSSAQT